jgi:hypothetical protein
MRVWEKETRVSLSAPSRRVNAHTVAEASPLEAKRDH